MTGLITIRGPVMLPAAPPPDADPLPVFDQDGEPIEWSHREAAGLRFARWRAQRGEFDDDISGTTPEPLPPIVRESDR